MRGLLPAGFAGLLIAGCSASPGSGLAITVHFAASSQAQCAIVGVEKEDSSNTFETLPPVARRGKSSILVGVERNASIHGRVVPYAQGYRAADCTGAVAEESRSATAIDLDVTGVQVVSLTLHGPQDDGGTGGGEGGGAGGGSGGGLSGGSGGGVGGGSGGSGGGAGGGSGGGLGGGSGGGNAPPTVTSTTPLNLATNISTGNRPTATFSGPMNAATITSLTFTVLQGSNPVSGAVTLDGPTNTATFTPAAPLGNTLLYTATITTGAKDSGGLALVANRTWSFTTASVWLGTAQTYSVLGTTVTNTAGPTTLTGDLGVSPDDAGISGFPPGLVSGTTHAGDAEAAQAQSDLLVAYTDVAARAPGDAGAVVTGLTLNAGVYKSTAALSLTTLTLDGQGNPDAVFIFQVDGALTMAAMSKVEVINSAQASHVFWQVVGAVTVGAGSTFRGTILGNAAITVGDGASVEGRVLALTRAATGVVTLSSNTIVTAVP